MAFILFQSYNDNMDNDTSLFEKLKELRCCGSESGSGRLESLDVSGNPLLEVLHCYGNPSLTKIWLKTGQTIGAFLYDSSVSTLNYK